jgi:hypothetical protein
MYVTRRLLVVGALALLLPGTAVGAVRAGQPFPTDRLTVRDAKQLTGLRVALPKPADCTAQLSVCGEVGVLDTLDGFSVYPRVSIPFSGPIDTATVSGATVYLLRLGPAPAKVQRIPLDRFVWTPRTNTLHALPSVYLSQDSPYAIVVTRGVHGADGAPVATSGGVELFGSGAHVTLRGAAAVGLFTTGSVSALLQKVHAQIAASKPAPATFAIGAGGATTVFPFASVLGLVFNREVGPGRFVPSTIPAAIDLNPGAIATVAFGAYSSPSYERADGTIPAYPTRTGTPAPVTRQVVYFNLYLPSGSEPAAGWPVAIFGHGFGDSKQGAPLAVASTMAKNGIATIAINVVGHGGGANGTLTAALANGTTVTFPAGGRGLDQNGDGTIDSTEGVNATGANTLVSSRDGLRQTAIDLMQLTRELQVGVDVNGDGRPDLDPARITYFGQSFGGIYGSIFLATESSLKAGVLNVPGGPIIEIARLSPIFRPLIGAALLTRTPPLYNNAAPDAALSNFQEDEPLSGQPVLVDTVAGADAIQQYLDRSIWAGDQGDPVAYAPYIRAEPLAGNRAKPVLVQFAQGDMTVPNPTASALIAAGRLQDRATYFRNDLAVATIPGYTTRNPHTFLTSVTNVPQATVAVPAQQQIATFLGSLGATIVDPDGAGPLFETPIQGPLPQSLNFLP